MQGLIQQITMIAQQANETDEQRATRLSEAASGAECDSTTLYEVEQDLRGLARHYAAQNPEKLAEVRSLGQMYAPSMGMDPDAAEQVLSVDTAAALLGQYATRRPDLTALLVKSLHESFERRGLYDELGTETPPAGALEPDLLATGHVHESMDGFEEGEQ